MAREHAGISTLAATRKATINEFELANGGPPAAGYSNRLRRASPCDKLREMRNIAQSNKNLTKGAIMIATDSAL